MTTWNYYTDRAANFPFEDMPAELRGRWIAAIHVWRDELGRDFLKSHGATHPIVIMLQNGATGAVWAIEKIINSASDLLLLKADMTSYRKLKEKLYSPAKCKNEGMPFLDVAAMFMAKGYGVTFLDEVPGRKNPDIGLTDPLSGEKLFIEVSRLEVSDDTLSSERSYRDFCALFPFVDIPYSCYQARNFAREDIADVLDRVQAHRVQTLSANDISYHEDSEIRLAMAPIHMRAEFEDWCMANNMRSGLHGKSLDFDETRRIKNNKLDKECKQILPGTSGLVIIPCHAIYFYMIDVEQAVHSFQQVLDKYPSVLGIAVYADILDATEEVIFVGEGYHMSVKLVGGVLARKILFVENTHCFKLNHMASVRQVFS